MSKFTAVILLAVAANAVIAEDIPFFNDVEELVNYWGFPYENHMVTTEDGYILNMHRIPSSQPTTDRVVLLQHGLQGDSSNFIFGPTDTVIFIFLF